MKLKMAEENLRALKEAKGILEEFRNGGGRLQKAAVLAKLEDLVGILNKNTPSGFDYFSVSSDFLADYADKGRSFAEYKEQKLFGWKHLAETALNKQKYQ